MHLIASEVSALIPSIPRLVLLVCENLSATLVSMVCNWSAVGFSDGNSATIRVWEVRSSILKVWKSDSRTSREGRRMLIQFGPDPVALFSSLSSKPRHSWAHWTNISK